MGILHLQRHQAGLDQPGLRVAADGHSRRRFLGLRSIDFERCGLSDSVKISLNDNDRKRAKQIAGYPWFAHKKPWQKEIEKLLDNGFKLEVEALISKDISYVTEEYTPQRLEGRGLAGLSGRANLSNCGQWTRIIAMQATLRMIDRDTDLNGQGAR